MSQTAQEQVSFFIIIIPLLTDLFHAFSIQSISMPSRSIQTSLQLIVRSHATIVLKQCVGNAEFSDIVLWDNTIRCGQQAAVGTTYLCRAWLVLCPQLHLVGAISLLSLLSRPVRFHVGSVTSQ